MKNQISNIEVANFKKKWCNENQIISEIIKNQISDYFKSPVLDVGAGLGDIVYNALYDSEVICIDVNKITERDFPLAENHKRIQVDFFNYNSEKKINTIFISHTLQFIDEDVPKLNEKLNDIDPVNLILVINKNDDFMGELIKWANQHFEDPNPEIKLKNFPKGYSQVDRVEFKTKLSCNNFNHLAKQVSYLMLIDLDAISKPILISFLTEQLDIPEFEFNQVIEIYTKNGGK